MDSQKTAAEVQDAPVPIDGLCVIIPVYNELDTVLGTLEQVLAVPVVAEVIVVDDGSDDGTTALLQGLRSARVRVVTHPRRRGKGAAIRTGIPLVRAPVTVIQDADMEYTPDQLPLLYDIIRQGRASVVYGSRFKGQITGMMLANRLGNRLLTLFTNLLYHSNLTDEATCYKMFRSDLLKTIPLNCTRFEFCPEVTAKVLRQGIPIIEVPIRYHARPHSAGKKIRWWDLIDAITTLVRYRFTR